MSKRVVSVGLAFGLAILAASDQAEAQQVLKVGYPYASFLSALPGATPDNFKTLDPKSAKGALIDLIGVIAKDAGFQVQLVPVANADLLTALANKDIDVDLYAPSNAANVSLSQPILKNSEILIVGKGDTKDYRTWDDLKGEVVGIQPTNLCFAEVQKGNPFKELKVIPGADFDASVNNGTLKYGLAGQTILWMSGGNDAANPDVRWVGSYQPHCTLFYGLGIRPGDDALLGKLNASIAKLKADGTIKSILTKFNLAFAQVN